ncbi:MAG: hypothetical protein AAFX87_26300 [Bacteroidota bacterium]
MKIKLILLFALISLSSFDEQRGSRVAVADGISVVLPKRFQPMTESDIVLKYPSVRQPLAAYTSEDRLADFNVNISATQWNPSDIAIAKDFFKASVVNLYDKVSFLQDEIKEVNGKQFVTFELETLSRGDRARNKASERRYVYVQYTIMKGKTLVFSFNCPLQMKDDWYDPVHKMMESVKIKNKF